MTETHSLRGGAPRSLFIRRVSLSACALGLFLAALGTAHAEEAPEPAPGTPPVPAAEKGAALPAAPAPVALRRVPYVIGVQSTVVGQGLLRFHSPYSGAQSLRSANQAALSETYTLILGLRPVRNLEVFVNPELARGEGIGNALGLAGYTNGDFIDAPSSAENPYLARYYLRYTIPLTRETEAVRAGENRLADNMPVRRVNIRAGGFAPNDLFDVNSFATNPRTQFLNYGLSNSAAYDYAQNTRGYTRGLTVSWINPRWSLRAGSFQMPRVAGGLRLAGDLAEHRGDQVELELHPRLVRGLKAPGAVRLMAFRNVAEMGRYRDALRRARRTGSHPDVTAVRRDGAVKYGFVLGLEQALGDEGATGLFARLGWNDGRTESFCYTECDRALSLGAQVSGRRWGRAGDHAGIAVAQNGLSGVHRRYLAEGGPGFNLGDGRLSYEPERVLETYYSFRISRPLSLSLDYQLIANPGYNRNRGPVSVLGLRLHLQY